MVCISNIITMPNWNRGVEQCSFITALFPFIPNDMIHACSISSNKQIKVNSIILIGVKIERLLQFIVLFYFCVIRKTSWFNKLVPIRGEKNKCIHIKNALWSPFQNKSNIVLLHGVRCHCISALDSVFDPCSLLRCSTAALIICMLQHKAPFRR